jgi:hypothetical protein
MSESLLDMLRQRERPGYFVQPTVPPRDITSLSEPELNEFLRGFSFSPRIGGPPVSPYSAQDLRLELARRGPSTRRMDDGFEDALTQAAATAPATPPPTTTPPARPAPTTRSAPRTEETPATANATAYRERLAAAQPQGQGQPSVLDMLRQRMQSQMDDESNQRLREIGIGMLRSRSPNFFAALGEGLEAADTGSRTRMDRLRQLAETERQERALDIEERRRQEEAVRDQERLRLDALRVAQGNRSSFTFMPNAERTGVVAVDNRDPSRVIPVPGALLATDRTAREETALRQNARNEARRATDAEAARRTALAQTMSPEEIAAFHRTTEERLLASVGLTPLAGAGTSGGAAGGTGTPGQQRPIIRETYVPAAERR